MNIHWKNWCWSWSSNTLATWCKELTHWKRACCWERWMAKEEAGGRRGMWWLDDTMDMNLSKLGFSEGQRCLACCMESQSRTQLSDWTELNWTDALKIPEELIVCFLSCFSCVQVLWPHGLQHTKLLCPSPSPGACSNTCPLSQWCHPTISSSVVPFSSCLQSFPASGFFPMSQLFASGG